MKNPLSRRMPKAWARLGAVAVGTCALGVAAVAILLHEEAPARTGPATSPRPPARADVASVATRPSTPVLAPPRPTPTTIAEATAARAPSDLAAWVTDRSLEARLRYTALRRLETQDPDEAVTAALAVLDDVTPLVRLNAIALLTRAQDSRADSRAQTALAQLDDRSRRLAGALARR